MYCIDKHKRKYKINVCLCYSVLETKQQPQVIGDEVEKVIM